MAPKVSLYNMMESLRTLIVVNMIITINFMIVVAVVVIFCVAATQVLMRKSLKWIGVVKSINIDGGGIRLAKVSRR